MNKIEKYFKWIVLCVAVITIGMYFINNRYFIIDTECLYIDRTKVNQSVLPDLAERLQENAGVKGSSQVLDRWTGETTCKR